MNSFTYCEQLHEKPKGLDVHYKAGAQMIKSFCAMYLFKSGVSIDFVDWSTENFNDNEEHVLRINNNCSLDIELKFHANELVKYARNRDMRKIEKKIIQHINKIISL